MKRALSLAGLTGQELVVDTYCGIGTIGIIASKAAGKVIGVELNQDAVRDAVNNAKMNGIGNIRFYCNDAGRFLVNMAGNRWVRKRMWLSWTLPEAEVRMEEFYGRRRSWSREGGVCVV